MFEIEVVLGLLAAIAALATVARRLGLPYPIFMVLGGFPPGFQVQLDGREDPRGEREPSV